MGMGKMAAHVGPYMYKSGQSITSFTTFESVSRQCKQYEYDVIMKSFVTAIVVKVTYSKNTAWFLTEMGHFPVGSSVTTDGTRNR